MDGKIENIIVSALSELNEERENKIDVHEDLVLMGKNGVLDSLDLVNLTVIIEEHLQDQMDLSVTLSSEKAFSRKKSPFYNIQSLIEFIVELSEENK